MKVTLKVWKQSGPGARGELKTYESPDVSGDCSFLEMLDILNNQLEGKNEEPVAFDSDCREGICGTCGIVINGKAHGPGGHGIATCQLYMREFKDGETLVLEPFRAAAFPVVKDLVVNRSAFDRVIQSGGFVSVNAGQAPEANANLVPKVNAELAMDAAACIGCGACVASCKNASAMLFVSAKVSHLSLLPQGQPERESRVIAMVEQMDKEGFGACTNEYECEAACPKKISVANIARLNVEYWRAKLVTKERTGASDQGAG